jgi:Calx-beta domain
MAISTAAQNRLKAIVYQVAGDIQGSTERRIQEGTSYVKQRLSTGTIDPNAGPSGVRLRYRTAVPEKRAYVNILTEGTTEENVNAPNCSGDNSSFPVEAMTRGSAMCNMPETTIHGGYDSFGRTIMGRAWGTDPVCPWDFLSDVAKGEAYFDGLIRDLPIRAANEFNEALEDAVLRLTKYNFSMLGGWTHSTGTFPAVPQGTLDIGYLKRIEPILTSQLDWGNHPFEIEVGREALTTAIRAWNQANGVTIQATKITDNTNGLIGVETLEFEGIRFVINKMPTRGYLRTTGSGEEFVRIPHEINRSGTGNGVVADLNEDYFNCTYYCDGKRHEVFEVARIIHPLFAERQAMAPVIHKHIKLQNANMEVKWITGAHLDCNQWEDKGKYSLRHVFGLQLLNPELASHILYRTSPPPITVVSSTCPTDCVEDFGDPVTMAELPPPDSNECFDADYLVTEQITHEMDVGTVEAPGPDVNAVGVVRFVGIDVTATPEAGTVYLIVERTGGYNGQTTIDVDSANGTATGGSDFTVVNTTLTWEDGESGRKRVPVTILAAATAGQAFTVALSNVTNSTLDADDDTTTITFAAACA